MSHENAPVRGRRGRKPSSHFSDGLFHPIRRPRLCEEVIQQMRERIADGRLPASAPIVKSELARQLGVSRTPLHEAVTALALEGLVLHQGGNRWMVAPLTEREASEIYPILGALESLALKLAGSSILGALDELRSEITRSEGPTGRKGSQLQVEAGWHELLLACSPNRTLVEQVRGLILRASRYESAYLQAERPLRLRGDLDGVVRCLERGDIASASRSLEIHWRDRGDSVLNWIHRVLGTEQPPTPAEKSA